MNDAERIAHSGAKLVATLQAEGSGFDPDTLAPDARDAYVHCLGALLSAGYLAFEHPDYSMRPEMFQAGAPFRGGGYPTPVPPESRPRRIERGGISRDCSLRTSSKIFGASKNDRP